MSDYDDQDPTHGGNHAPLPHGVLLDPDYCEGCDEKREVSALSDAAHEIEHSISPEHPNAGYRDGHAHTAWVVRSLLAADDTEGKP